MVTLSLQNLGRRKARTLLLVMAVAISSAMVFAGVVLIRSIDNSMAVGFSRIGADLMVVPENTLTNITAALLTVEPSDNTVSADLFEQTKLAGVERAAPQRVFRTPHSGFVPHGQLLDLIGFDPELDFTVRPWISERLPRAMQTGDVILGAAHDQPLGAEIQLFGKPFRVYAKLGRTGVGTHEGAVFMSSADLIGLGSTIRDLMGTLPPMLDPAKVSGFLVQIAPGSTDLQVRFALLSRLPGIAAVSGASMLTRIRQGLVALLGGTLALVAMTFASTAVMVGVLFSAIVTERRGELGLLKAIGAGRLQIVGLMLSEAMIATGFGGLVGVGIGALLLRLFERSLVYHLMEMGIPFLWLDLPSTIVLAVVCVLAALLVGAAGALLPAWRASGRDAYDLIRAEG